MDKKDIYDHLAKIYLDASSKKNKKRAPSQKLFRNLFLISVIFIFGLSATLGYSLKNKRHYNQETALILLSEPAKINFNFDPAKKEIFSLDLKKLNLVPYKALTFAVKKTNETDMVSLRVEFVNAYKEKSEVYLKDIQDKWQEYKIKFSDFKNISDWSEMMNLLFTVEVWNARGKKGVVYLEEVRFLR